MPAPPEVPRQAYRVASWATAGLAFVAAALTFGFGLAALVGPAPSGDQRVTTGPGSTGSDTTVLARDQSIISGTITKLVGTRVEGAPPLALPLTMTVRPQAGVTKGEFSGGAVGGKNATISWDGGRPLPLRGEGSIDLNGPVNVELSTGGASWALDGTSRLLTPGSYTFGAAVAVSTVIGGLGTPRESAKLDVPQGAAASLKTNGDVRVATEKVVLPLRGPGQLVVEGVLEVRTRDGVQQARKITFGPGPFELDLEPDPVGYRVARALLQGPMTVEG